MATAKFLISYIQKFGIKNFILNKISNIVCLLYSCLFGFNNLPNYDKSLIVFFQLEGSTLRVLQMKLSIVQNAAHQTNCSLIVVL